MAWSVRHTEHCGAKNGGGHWGTRREAKSGSSHRRREADKEYLRLGFRVVLSDRVVGAGGTRETR